MAEIKQAKNPLSKSFLSDEQWGRLPQSARESILKKTAKYGDNKWWLSKDLAKVARYQAFERIFLVDPDLYRESLEKLLGKPISKEELGSNLKGLTKEAQDAIMRKGYEAEAEYYRTHPVEKAKMDAMLTATAASALNALKKRIEDNKENKINKIADHEIDEINETLKRIRRGK